MEKRTTELTVSSVVIAPDDAAAPTRNETISARSCPLSPKQNT
jgi:hypothetical protein